jgi:phytoene dehydrogenase-like protein
MFGAPSRNFDRLAPALLGPPARVLGCRPPAAAISAFVRTAARTATAVAGSFASEAAGALFVGSAAHAIQPLTARAPSAVGAALITAGHAVGWPVAVGGSRAISDSLASYLRSLGGEIRCDVLVDDLSELPAHRLLLLDTSPQAAAALLGSRLPGRIERAYRSWKNGPGAFKVDLAIDGEIPWSYEPCRRAGVVHVGGTVREIALAEASVARGSMPEKPFVLVGQQYLADPGRSVGGINPIWAYAHVPNGWNGDATESILRQIERFAPGFRDRIVAIHSTGTAALSADNANYRGGDIAGGATTLRQVVFRPRVGLDPYFTGIDGVFLCSSSTPPGAGVHGMCGVHAAEAALRRL